MSTNSKIIDRFLMRLTSDESEINLATGEADPEFSEWKWASPEEVIEQVVLLLLFLHAVEDIVDYHYLCWHNYLPETLILYQAVDYKRPTYEEVVKTFRPYLSAGKATKCSSAKW